MIYELRIYRCAPGRRDSKSEKVQADANATCRPVRPAANSSKMLGRQQRAVGLARRSVFTTDARCFES